MFICPTALIEVCKNLHEKRTALLLHVRKLSPIVIVKPKASINMASTSKLFIGANSEIACGSSCSPANVSLWHYRGFNKTQE